ncbi:MAG: hypothetical protein K2P92_07675, partial [Bdellovibrionaceae bacterium]|nr:hypothetical protein [Pseudobdellovibrionaceae bacterium]
MIKQIDYALAKAFILQYEWLGNMGAGNICFGLFYEDHLLAVAVFGPHLGSVFKLNKSEGYIKILQLHRGASAPACPVWGPSKLIRGSLDILESTYKA